MPTASGTGAPPGAVELREDVPLKAGSAGGAGSACAACAGAAWCAAGPRLIAACFAALSAAITLALITQIYSGDYEVVPHGSVSSSAAECSRAGTDALKAGGRALDAAVAAALCLAVVAPHRTSLDASGALLYWEYRRWRSQPPELVEWGGAGGAEGRAPRLLAALAALHARRGALPWPRLLQTAVDLARDGFAVSEGLATALAAEAATGTAGSAGAAPSVGSASAAPALAAYLATLQHNSSAELSAAWNAEATLTVSTPAPVQAGAWRLLSGRAAPAHALAAALPAATAPPPDPDDLSRRVISELQKQAADGTWSPYGVATGLAVVDQLDTYVALVTGLSAPFGSGPATAAGWTRDEPAAPLDLAPAIMLDQRACGTRYVVGAESSGALAQGAAALAGAGSAGAVERARVALGAGGALALEALRPAPGPAALPEGALLAANATPPYAAVNVVQQRGDALMSHADSRGGGLASRF